MRLIDADSIQRMSFRAQGGRDYDHGFDDGEDYVMKKIAGAPTVEAIPVEWLQKKTRVMSGQRHIV